MTEQLSRHTHNHTLTHPPGHGILHHLVPIKAETKAVFSSQVSYVVAFSICSLLMYTKRLSVQVKRKTFTIIIFFIMFVLFYLCTRFSNRVSSHCFDTYSEIKNLLLLLLKIFQFCLNWSQFQKIVLFQFRVSIFKQI